jgi:hypothetical protein
MLEAGAVLADFVKALVAQGWEFPITEVAVSKDGAVHAYQRIEMKGQTLEIKELFRYLPNERMGFPAIYTFVDARGRMQSATMMAGKAPQPLLPDSGIVH